MRNGMFQAATAAVMAALAISGCGGDSLDAAPASSAVVTGNTTATVPGDSASAGATSGANGSTGSNGNGGADGAAPPARTDIPGLTKFVNVLIGTGAPDAGGLYPGNVNPAAQAPFGMVSFGPDTPGSRSPWGNGSGGYYYADTTIDFFSLTHLSGPGCRGQGAVAMIPGGRSLSFSHKDEVASPGYYRVKTGNGILNELTATTRTGMARLTYPAGASPNLVINALRSNGMKSGVAPSLVDLKVDVAAGVVSGKTVVGAFCGGTWYKPVYFYIKLDTPLDPAATKVAPGVATLVFAPKAGGGATTVQLKAGISSVSVANAQLNLTKENPGWSFDTTRNDLDAAWNSRLNTIQLDLAQPNAMKSLGSAQARTASDHVTQFYTALYRTLAGPTVYSDVNGEYRSMRQLNLGDPGNTAPQRETANVSQDPVPDQPRAYRTHYSSFSLWDTYRSVTQLQALLFPGEASDMMQSLVVDAKQCGAFPHWVDGSDDTKPMEGDHAPNVIAGAYAFGARGFDLAAARKYMLQSAFGTGGPGSAFVEGACNNLGSVDDSAGVSTVSDFYLKNGYVSTNVAGDHHAGSMTLELSTTDVSVGNFLAALGRAEDAGSVAALRRRGRNWINIFNADIPANSGYYGESKGLVTKDSSGQWDFSENNNRGFHESTEPNYTWTIGHDYAELIKQLGGNAAAIARLNTLFGLSQTDPFNGPLPSAATLNSGESGSTLYIGNEPALQTPWAYNWAGRPQLTQRVIPVVMTKTFFNTPGGLPGNDDFGATSAFYLWASLGLYPVIPSAPGMAMSTPQFKGMTIWLADGTKKLRIEADDEALLNGKPYIKSVRLNGKTYPGSWLPLAAIAGGGTLTYTLSATPTNWAADPSLAPPSGPGADYTKPGTK
ncbi:GH92 family glycosyl hydrolase (plasmid) [Burkholderia sp. FERM BP-3421]|uniref:GH92 family glycosyl hydrolase n=1 Tax=Burkholderia sp. FERM BP-3421 TaxID=1494466 RepID=UPI00235E4ED0|nr:GH92 family glycosyl hydrolase [Burkholderia sp. FERM BP-3421]WDD90761.1 GH92 family glycosyl hydrolase [Burkholderia sp. FERM BP-3421]